MSEEEAGCKGYTDRFGDYDCGYGSPIPCEDCKHGSEGGKLDPEKETENE